MPKREEVLKEPYKSWAEEGKPYWDSVTRTATKRQQESKTQLKLSKSDVEFFKKQMEERRQLNG